MLKRYCSTCVAKDTVLAAWHNRLRGKMTEFCGYNLPVVYPDKTISESVIHTRTAASLFDVSHMGQLRIHGSRAAEFLESLTPANVKGLKPGKATLTQLTNTRGGILDDTIVFRRVPGAFDMVVNAVVKDSDLKHLRASSCKYDVDIEVFDGKRGLLALQGPAAASVLQPLVPSVDFTKMPFMSTVVTSVLGVNEVFVTRCGYTGEDGFEISVPGADAALGLANKLTEHAKVAAAGLGARDVLRLEAGLCLMTADMDGTTTPVEAGLNFTLPKVRRETGVYPGSDVVRRQLKLGIPRVRVGLMLGRIPARPGSKVYIGTAVVGVVTSGTFSPVLKKAISMAYVPPALSKLGSEVTVDIRGKHHKAVVTKMPFVPSRYFRVKKDKKKKK